MPSGETALTDLDLLHLRAALDNASTHAAPAGAAAEPGSAAEQAAVAAVLRAPSGSGSGDIDVLLIERAVRPDDPWSGHMALPGGRRDPVDADLHATVRREVLEEVGLDLQAHGELIGALPVLDTRQLGLRHSLVIAPYVFALSGTPQLNAGPEVADLLWTPLGPIVAGERDTEVSVERGGVRLSLPGWCVGGRVVWGLTYHMLYGLFGIAGWLTQRERPDRPSSP